jgi:hydrogenase/urease accessory protein HupE
MNTCFTGRFCRSLWRWVQCALCMAPLTLSAHVVETGHATVSLSDKQVFVAISIPVAALTGADDNADGVLDTAEIQAHQSALIAQVQGGIGLAGDGRKAVWSQMLLLPGQAPDAPSSAAPSASQPSEPPPQPSQQPQRNIVLVGSAAWDFAPEVVTLDYGLWSRASPAALGAPQPVVETLKVKVSRTQDGKTVAEEVGLLSPQQPQLEFFAPVQRHVANFAWHGFDHILGGPDHIVFLVALLASGIGLRRWAALLTAFTVAHGATFGLASMGWVSVPADVVEPAIAASIVVVAALHLLRMQMGLRWELLLVFGMGLVHGLGFASAMRADAGNPLIATSPYPVWSIVGFNLGVEAGQAAVAFGLYAVVWVLRRLFARQGDAVWQRTAGACAMALGLFWLLERLV